ncbi:lysostaphin resistance A-like protein [Hafnia paralvei]|uniref:CPBP family intramembrane glutamic endopeptidase n=2 Tax=Enterobacterales TaxID=91347 RepID=UPI003A100214
MIRKNTHLIIVNILPVLFLIGITFYTFLLPNRSQLYQAGLAVPILCVLEFICITPIYLIFFRNGRSMGIGFISSRLFFILLASIIFCQYAGPVIMGMVENKELTWNRELLTNPIFLTTIFLIIFIVPIYEEIVFRGCLLDALSLCFRGKVYLASIVTSITFAFLHTQYTDIRALIILFAISNILVCARVSSKGLLMPILLHISMNGIVMGVKLVILTN